MTNPIKYIFLSTVVSYSDFASGLDLFVSQTGSDQANGLSANLEQAGGNGPFQTIERAQQAIRTLKTDRKFTEPVTIHIQSGTYTLSNTLYFDERDSGTPSKKIHWLGENGPVLISGGITLQNCKHEISTIWSCKTENTGLDNIKYNAATRKHGNIPGFDLFVGQQRLTLARWPNTDWAHIKTPLDKQTTFSSFEKLPEINKNDLNNAQVHIFSGNDWFDEYIGISSIEQDQITLATKVKYPLASGRRYYLHNIQSELDSPGEWFYDQPNNTIKFIPPNNSTQNTITAAKLKNLAIINNANNIDFSNLTFSHSTDIAFTINDSNHITIDHFEFSHTGAKAIEAKNSNNVVFSNSHVYDTGEGGIYISGGNRNTLESGNNIVHNNHIHDFGNILMTYTPAIEIAGVGARITHNLVEQSPGGGILINGNDHLIEKNEIHNVCEQASDCGAIYSGRDWTYRGNVIKNNSIHDLSGYGLKNVDIANNIINYVRPSNVKGVYLDDGASGFTVIGNILNYAGYAAIFLGGGRDNYIENNVILTESFGLWIDNRWPDYKWSENKKSLTTMPYRNRTWSNKYPKLSEPMHNETWPEGNNLQRNIIVSTNAKNSAFQYILPKNSNYFNQNLVWGDLGQINVDYIILDENTRHNSATWQGWVEKGLENNSVFADPCLKITGNQVSFCPQSPVSNINFKPLPTDIGIIK
ncbi:right-handed parallel beta-helix repeat-containing protein [Methylomonas sp. TEB]|uniref:right-handed parallel beta-helix repeat-containing protein n=1 Tax=Methylomonas sp. TEB TaxID=3398229 RepID=UPI0039F58905